MKPKAQIEYKPLGALRELPGNNRVLERIRQAIEDENVSYSDIVELQNHTEEIKQLGDPILAEWAGIPEDEFRGGQAEKTNQGGGMTALEASQNIYPIEPIKPSDEWQKIDKVVKQSQDQFLRIEPGEISPAAKAILAHDYTPEGRAAKQLMESLDSEDNK